MTPRERIVFQAYKRLYRFLPRWARPMPDGARRVLLYHNVDDRPSPFVRRLGITISSADFEAHLRFLTSQYRVVPFSTLLGEPEGSGAVAVTFDDGFRSIVDTALPLLERYDVPAKVYLNGMSLDGGLSWLTKLSFLIEHLDEKALGRLFTEATGVAPVSIRDVSPFVEHFTDVTVGVIDRAFAVARPASLPRLYLDRDEVRRLAEHPLVELGSHTRSHFPLNKISSEILEAEVVGFHEELVAEFGSAIDGFCVPFCYREHVTEAVANVVRRVDERVVTAYGGRVALDAIHGVPELRRVGAWGNLGVLWHQLVVHG